MKNLFHSITLIFLLSAGEVALGRFFHPATFSPLGLLLLLTLFAGSATLAFWKE